MLKSIQYAYPSSQMAERFRRADQGCFYIDVKPFEASDKSLTQYGPFCELENAEHYAEQLGYDWSRYSKRAKSNSVALSAVMAARPATLEAGAI